MRYFPPTTHSPSLVGRCGSVARRIARPDLFHLFQRARPILVQKPRERAIGEQLATVLTARAVVRLIVGIDDTLHRRATHRTRLTVLAVYRHSFAERGDLFRKAVLR